MAGKKKKKKYRAFWFFVKLQMVLLLLVGIGVGWYFLGGYAQEVQALKTEAEKLVRESSYDTFRGSQTSIAYAADGSVISTMKGEKESYYLEIEDIPSDAVAAIVSIEDKKFYRHDGVDYRALLRAVKAMIQNGQVTQGGSTITMQLARNVFISQERTWQRKVEEIFIAWEMEEKYTKDEILEFYLNNIYFGNGYYGLQSASRGYFSSEVEDLSLSQIAFLCAIPNNPTLYDPVTNRDNTIARRDRILSNMYSDGKISEVAYANAVTEEITLERPESMRENDYLCTYTYYCATRALMENEDFVFRNTFSSEEDREAYEEEYAQLYAACQKELFSAGYQIYTSLDLSMQEQLQSAVDTNLAEFTEVNEEGVYALQASAVCIDNQTGYVKAIVGGRDQDFSGFTLNRAYQSFRQPGSAVKPLTVYTPSFERNYTPDSIVVDEPIEDGPKNANGTYVGEITVRQAVEKSVNTIAWKLYSELTPEVGLSYLLDMNFSHLDEEDYRPATALGGFTYGVSALEMAAGYAALENDGIYRTPTCIVKILDGEGNEIYSGGTTEKQVYRQNAARMMTDVLKGVFVNGTAKGLGLTDMPCAGKTGTTNDSKDGWFVGYTRYYTTSVWVGYDLPQKLKGLQGASYPGNIWKDFMEPLHEGLEPLDFLPSATLSEEFIQENMQEEEPEEEIPPVEEEAQDQVADPEVVEETLPVENEVQDQVNEPENGVEAPPTENEVQDQVTEPENGVEAPPDEE